MIELSYENVKNGLDKQISMTCLCTTQQETDRVFRNALVLWGDLPTSRPHLNERLIDMVTESGKMFSLRFQRFEAYASSNWKGFRGVFMLHPSINPQEILPRMYEQYKEMVAHNERYLEQWRA
ncbi:hypothetical protein vBRpoPV14_53 [Ruegeria phage vB_RpoP-V14]|uniref:Uncharacterized protein n=4 Tax=Aorunvirus V12 TaxID=2846074 RepID=A0A2Z4QGW6_9CAUD|nr:hypothetical protein HYP62_gp51 [Ruegeria phage vB_RpoP-V12]AWY08838.1 hypothetical protein vBRpoPV12_51 [Ruegeria phage vB_RpoP-V12]AWY09006.1 hypothetical protein vBRpoPV21_48 [Ruegeria phage vB_RpoP-V21]AWY09567.1 hypothetical protein vBRpoPV17_48 [Ruegeria phage vB_RpoP-V17]AXF42171.1 hypothetical protein vBRpoPV14_53 [Ruegeria phage vB_RpoP-V14]